MTPLPQPIRADVPTPASTSLLSHMDSDHLARMRRELTVIPGDLTSQSHIVALVRSLISRELSDPARVEADRARAEKLAAETRQKAIDDLKAKQEAEKAALVPPPGIEPLAVQADLDEKHAAEAAALEYQHALDDLAKQQVEERKAFDAKQVEERAALTPQSVVDPRRPDPRDPQFARP